ncbi:MAG: Ig-like domain-containing protein, partial [candidate division Zixibacteria bacterium]
PTYTPSVTINVPVTDSEYTPGDTVEFTATLTDSDSDISAISVQWTSSIDGIINSSPAIGAGLASFSTTALARGVHTVSIRVIDPDDNWDSDTVEVRNVLPTNITLSDPIKELGTVSLVWSKNNDTDFAAYKVFRSDAPEDSLTAELLAEYTNADDTTFIDSLPPLAQSAYYRVFIFNTGEYYKASIEKEVVKPGGLILDFVPYDAVKHPTNPWIYVLESSYGAADNIVLVNYQEMTVLNSISLNGDVGYMAFGDNGQGNELYVPMKTEGWIKIYDENLNNIDNINTLDFVGSVAIDGNGLVFADVDPSPWWDYPIRSYLRSTGAIIDSTGDSGSFGGGRIKMLPGGTEFIEISIGVSPVDMDYYRFDVGGNFLQHNNDSYHGDHSLDAAIYSVSPSGDYVISSSSGSVYSADSSMTFLANIPGGGGEFTDFEFDATGDIIYAAIGNMKSVKLISYGDYAELSAAPTRGYPYIIFVNDTQIISLSKPLTGSYEVGIDVVNIP